LNTGAAPEPLQTAAPVQTPAPTDSAQTVKQQTEPLSATVAAQSQEIAHLKGALEIISQHKESSLPATIAAAAAIVGAVLTGIFAVASRNKQAAQERLLKAIDIIMQSRSGYQADVRRKNLMVFLDKPTQAHLDKIKTEFAGPEHTDLHVALAQGMAEKAETPEQVLEIWKTVLQEKKMFDKVVYPQNSLP
jgi:uncharacterized membrane protein YciS (DUF1049 family)